MRDNSLHQEYSPDGAFRFEVYHDADFYEVWVQRKITDEYMGPNWFTYYDMPSCRHCTDTLERAIEIGRDDLRVLSGQSDENENKNCANTMEQKRSQSMKTVTLYTDGTCSGNPGPGGGGAILSYNGHELELSGGEAKTTNNRMELTAVIAGLQKLKEPCIVELYSDSKYVIDALEKGWAWGWKKKGWIKSDKKPALNPDLWDTLLALTQKHELHYHWVKGHADNEYNNRCDALAVAQSQLFK